MGRVLTDRPSRGLVCASPTLWRCDDHSFLVVVMGGENGPYFFAAARRVDKFDSSSGRGCRIRATSWQVSRK